MRNHPRAARRLAVILASSLLALAAACGSDSGGGSTDTPSDESIDLAPFQAKVDAATEALTDKTFNGPTKAFTAPRDIKLAIVPCSTSTEGCNSGAESVKIAANVLGWKSQIFDGKNDPITQQQVIEQAVNAGFEAVMLVSIDPNVVKAGLSAAAKKNVPVGSYQQFIPPSPGGVAFDIGVDYRSGGETLGAYIVAESKGKARLLALNAPEFASAVEFVDGTVNEVKSCSTCSVASVEDFVAADVGPQLGVRVVNLLQNDPKITHVHAVFDGAASVIVPAIKQAGLADKVTVVGANGGAQNLEWIKNGGGQTADFVSSFMYTAFAGVDQLARLLAGEPLVKTEGVTDERIAYSEGVPFALITPDNVGDLKVGEAGTVTFAVDDVLAEEYGKLWGVTP